MHITVNVPDRYVAVDGLRVTITGALPDDSVRTLQYNTAAVEGVIERVDQQFTPIRDPAVVAPWVALWGYALTAKVEAATMEGRACDERYAEWQRKEAERTSVEQEMIRKAHEEADALAKAAQG